jgi:parvulin-like peptidyl-prolyl isomerase
MTGARTPICVLVSGCLAVIACESDASKARPYPAPEVSSDGARVASIGPVALTTVELEHRIDQQSPFIKNQMVSLEQRRKFVENEVRTELLAQEGWKRRLYDDPQVLQELKRAIVHRMINEQMRSIQAETEVSDRDLEAAYERKRDEYNKPEKVRLSQIVLSAGDATSRRDARKRLESLKAGLEDEAKRGNDLAFAEAAKRISEDPSAKGTGGDLQFLSKEELTAAHGPEIARRLFDELEVGELTIVETPKSLALFKKTGKRRAVVRTLEMVKPQLAAEVLNEKKNKAFEAAMERMKEAARVVIDEKMIEALKVEPSMPQLKPEAVVSDKAQEKE